MGSTRQGRVVETGEGEYKVKWYKHKNQDRDYRKGKLGDKFVKKFTGRFMPYDQLLNFGKERHPSNFDENDKVQYAPTGEIGTVIKPFLWQEKDAPHPSWSYEVQLGNKITRLSETNLLPIRTTINEIDTGTTSTDRTSHEQKNVISPRPSAQPLKK